MENDQVDMLRKEIDIIIHAASSINLFYPLRKACGSVIQTTEAVAAFGCHCDHLQRFVYVSTAYANAHLCCSQGHGDIDVKEWIVPLQGRSKGNSSPEEEYQEVQFRGSSIEFEENDFPWAYSYAKQLSERLVTEKFLKGGKSDNLLIIRPSVIGPAESFPTPGYAVPLSTPMTIIAAMLANSPAMQLSLATRLDNPESDSTLDEVPVDIVVDRLLGHLAYQTTGCVHAVSGERGRIKIGEVQSILLDGYLGSSGLLG